MESINSIGIILLVHLIFSFALISLNFGSADSWNQFSLKCPLFSQVVIEHGFVKDVSVFILIDVSR